MSLRAKFVGVLVALAVVTTASIGLFAVRATTRGLQSEIDRSLRENSSELARLVTRPPNRGDRPPPGRVPGFFRRQTGNQSLDLIRGQFVQPNGEVVAPSGVEQLPVTAPDLVLARSPERGTELFRNIEIDGAAMRMATTSVGDSRGAIQVARSLEENLRLQASLRNRVLLAMLGMVAAAAAAGWFIAGSLTDRLRRLTGVAEEVAGTGRLDVAVPVGGNDEAGRLGVALNEMLAALRKSEDDQQRLVQDAGHELKTPLTSLRANVAVLGRHPDLDPEQRARLVEDLNGETKELTDLVNELVALANGRRSDESVEKVVLAEVAGPVVERAQRRSGRSIMLTADDSICEIRRGGIERAISNLVDNAAKFDSTGGPIEVVIDRGRLEVRDRGIGVNPTDGDRLFDRFYRSEITRSQPGSGLGLAIVADVIRQHGGSVFASQREGGGAVIGFVLPLVA